MATMPRNHDSLVLVPLMHISAWYVAAMMGLWILMTTWHKSLTDNTRVRASTNVTHYLVGCYSFPIRIRRAILFGFQSKQTMSFTGAAATDFMFLQPVVRDAKLGTQATRFFLM